MANSNRIVKLADSFYGRAIFAQQNQQQEYASALLDKMKGLVRGGIVATNHLLGMEQYKNSVGLKAIQEKFPEIAKQLNNYSIKEDGEVSHTISIILEGLNFYTSSGNTGMGFDPATTASVGGYTAPSYYVKAIKHYNDKLGAIKPTVQKTTPDPIAVSLKRQESLENKPRKT